MATIRAYTTIEQSRKLSEILPIESADMNYWCGTQIRVGGHKTMDKDLDVPCWSLVALLKTLNFPSLTQNKEDEWEVCVFDHNNDNYIEKTANNPIDACYEMIIKLHELNLL